MLDPVSIGLAIKAMQTAYSGIQYCCEALADGKVQVQKIKKAAEDAQTIVKDVKSIWSVLAGLFRPKSAKQQDDINVVDTAKSTTKAPVKDVYITHVPTESEIIQKFVTDVGDFFHHHRGLSELYDAKSEEVFAMDRPDPRDILILSQIKNEIDGAYGKLSEMMRVRAPPQLGPLWDNFNEIYENAKQQQQARRDRERIRKANESWQRQEAYNDKVDLAVALFLTLLLVAELWVVWISSFTAE